MGSISGAEGASRNMYGGVEGILATGSVSELGQATPFARLRLVDMGSTAVRGVEHSVEDGSPVPPPLATATELGLTEEEHGRYIVESNAQIHPESD